MWTRWDRWIRDIVLWLVGVAGIVNELFLLPEPRPTALVFTGALVGLPFVLKADEGRRDG